MGFFSCAQQLWAVGLEEELAEVTVVEDGGTAKGATAKDAVVEDDRPETDNTIQWSVSYWLMQILLTTSMILLCPAIGTQTTQLLM